jgi:hypothetical protein
MKSSTPPKHAETGFPDLFNLDSPVIATLTGTESSSGIRKEVHIVLPQGRKLDQFTIAEAPASTVDTGTESCLGTRQSVYVTLPH